MEYPTRLRHSIGLVVFCLLAGDNWLVVAVWTEAWPPLLARSLHLALCGVLALILWLVRPSGKPFGKKIALQLGAASLLLFTAPALLEQWAQTISPETSVALYAFAPLFVAGIVTLTRDQTARSLMLPALTGLAGALLILPWQLPSNLADAISLVAVMFAVLLVAVASVWMHTLLEGRSLAQGLMVAAFFNADAIGVIALVRGDRLYSRAGFGPECLRGLLTDLPQLCLLLWLLREVVPERLASRFFLVPLVTILGGSIVLRAAPDLRSLAGLGLLLAGAALLLVGRQDRPITLDLG